MPVKFVNRKRELHTLKMIFERAKLGEGRTALVEGSAGTGKTALVEEFKKEISDAVILSGRADASSKYRPYSLFTEALSVYGDLRSIREVEEKRRIKELAQDLVVRPRMVFVDEVESGAARILYASLREELEGRYYSPRMPDDMDGVWLASIETERMHVDPSNLDFSVIPTIYDFFKSAERGVLLIENINYLIYLNGIDRVVEFLHAVYNVAGGSHVVVVSGRTEHLSEDEKNKLLSAFDELISLDIPWERKGRHVCVVQWKGDVDSKNYVVFSSRTGAGDYQVGRGELTAEHLDFEVFDRITSEMDRGNDVVLDCITYFLHYHSIRKLYLWLKSLGDHAYLRGVRLYIVSKGLSEYQMDMLRDLIDNISRVNIGNYEDIQESGTIKFYDSIFNFLDYNSRKKPIVLILEGLQWADRSSLELLRYLTRNIMKSRIMIVATYRNEDIVQDDEVASIIEDIQFLDNTHILRLNNLSKHHIEEMLRSVKSDLKKEDVELIYEKSDGNPLLALSILEHMDMESFVIPDTIRESVEMMLDSLDDRSLYLLRVMAVVGEHVPVDILDMLYPDWYRVFQRVSGKFVEKKGNEVHFIYTSYREIIYSDISRDTRSELHMKVGAIMEELGRVTDAAHHYYMAKSQKALKFIKLAAEESIKTMALGDAIDYCKMAIEIAQKYGMHRELITLYETLGDRYFISGNYRRAIEMYNRVLKLRGRRKVSIGIKIGRAYERLGEYEKALEILEEYHSSARGLERGKIYGTMGIIKWHLGDFKESEKLLNQYLKYAKKYRSIDDEAEAYRNLAIVYYYYANYDEGLKYAMKALDRANESGRYDLIANTYNVIGVLYERKLQFEEALQYFKKYLDISEKIGNFDYIAKAYNNLAIVYDFLGDVEKAKSYYILSMEMNFKVGNRRDIAISYNNLAVVESEFGDAQKAVEYLKMSLKYSAEINDTYNMVTTYMNLGSFYMDIMDYESALHALLKGLNMAKAENYRGVYITIASMLASLYVEMDELDKAKEYLDIAKASLSDEDKDTMVSVMSAEMDYYMKLGDIDRAENILEEAFKIAEETNDEDNIYFLMKYRAMLRCRRRDYNYATIYYEKVLEYYEKRNKKKTLADIHYLYAMCLAEFDRELARKHFAYAHTFYSDMNNIKRKKQVEEKMKELLGESP